MFLKYSGNYQNRKCSMTKILVLCLFPTLNCVYFYTIIPMTCYAYNFIFKTNFQVGKSYIVGKMYNLPLI